MNITSNDYLMRRLSEKAWCGISALTLAFTAWWLLGRRCVVIAVEPMLENVSYLERHISLNGIRNIEVLVT